MHGMHKKGINLDRCFSLNLNFYLLNAGMNVALTNIRNSMKFGLNRCADGLLKLYFYKCFHNGNFFEQSCLRQSSLQHKRLRIFVDDLCLEEESESKTTICGDINANELLLSCRQCRRKGEGEHKQGEVSINNTKHSLFFCLYFFFF